MAATLNSGAPTPKENDGGIVREIWVEEPRRNLSPEAFALYMDELKQTAAYHAKCATIREGNK